MKREKSRYQSVLIDQIANGQRSDGRSSGHTGERPRRAGNVDVREGNRLLGVDAVLVELGHLNEKGRRNLMAARGSRGGGIVALQNVLVL